MGVSPSVGTPARVMWGPQEGVWDLFPSPPAQLTSGPEPRSRQSRSGLETRGPESVLHGPRRPPPQQTVENGVGAGGYGVGQEAGLVPLVLGPAGPQPHRAPQTLRSLSHGVGSQGRW